MMTTVINIRRSCLRSRCTTAVYVDFLGCEGSIKFARPAMRGLLLVLLFVAPVLLHAQTPSEQKPLAFEVASIKRADPLTPRPGRLGSVNVVMTPGRLIARNASLKDLIRDAYSLDD